MARATRPRVLAELVVTLWPDVQRVKAGSEFMVPCPFCGSDKPKCAVNPDKGVFQCWVCGERGPTSKFLYHLKELKLIKQRDIDAIIIGKNQAAQLSDLKPVVPVAQEASEQFWTSQCPCVFPSGVFPLYDYEAKNKLEGSFQDRAISYLAGRGVSLEDIRRYRLHFCVKLGSPYHGHIFIPCLGKFGRQMTFWTTRSILPDPPTKSYHSGSKYSRFSAKTVMMNEHLVVDTTVALCEGPFDAFSIMKHVGIPAIPLLGKNLHSYHRNVLVERGVGMVYICLDSDAHEAIGKMGSAFKKNSAKFVYLVDGDPNDVAPEELKAAFLNAALAPINKLAATMDNQVRAS